MDRLVPKLKPLLVVLYGSFARGDYTFSSDVDLLVVADDIPDRYGDRWELVFDIVEGFPLDPHVYTPEEFRGMVRDGRMAALDALTEGVVIYAEPRFKREVDCLLREVLRRRVKLDGIWLPIELLSRFKG